MKFCNRRSFLQTAGALAAGGLFSARAEAAAATQVTPLEIRPISVLEEGAVGDGTTDDTAAIQKAFNKAANIYSYHREVMVDFPGGGHDYLITDTIKVPRGVRVHGGAGGYPTRWYRKVSVIWGGADDRPMFEVNGDDNYYDTYFEWLGFNAAGIAPTIVRFEGSSNKENVDTNTTFHRCSFNNTSGKGRAAIELDLPGTNWHLSHCRFDRIAPYAIYMPQGSSSFSFKEIEFDNGTGGLSGTSLGFIHIEKTSKKQGFFVLAIRDSRMEINAPMMKGLVTYTPHPEVAEGSNNALIKFDNVWAQGPGCTITSPSWLHIDEILDPYTEKPLDMASQVWATWDHCYGQVRNWTSGIVTSGAPNTDRVRGFLKAHRVTLHDGVLDDH